MSYYNPEHYSDPTAGRAVERVSRESRKNTHAWGKHMHPRRSADSDREDYTPCADVRRLINRPRDPVPPLMTTC